MYYNYEQLHFHRFKHISVIKSQIVKITVLTFLLVFGEPVELINFKKERENLGGFRLFRSATAFLANLSLLRYCYRYHNYQTGCNVHNLERYSL